MYTYIYIYMYIRKFQSVVLTNGSDTKQVPVGQSFDFSFNYAYATEAFDLYVSQNSQQHSN